MDFWVIIPCSLVGRCRRFGGVFFFCGSTIPRRTSASTVAVLHPSLPCATCLHLTILNFLVSFSTSSFHLALSSWCKLAWYLLLFQYPTRCNVTQFILSGNCSTCFGWYLHPSSGAQTASGICHTVTATCRYLGIVATVPTIPR